MILLAVLWFGCGILAAMIGARKGEGCLSFLAGVLLGPIGVVAAIFSSGNRRPCPQCREPIHKDATICPRCRSPLSP